MSRDGRVLKTTYAVSRELIFGQPCRPGRIAGVDFDGVINVT